MSKPTAGWQLVVEPTHLINMIVKMGSSSTSRDENNKYLKPTPSCIYKCNLTYEETTSQLGGIPGIPPLPTMHPTGVHPPCLSASSSKSPCNSMASGKPFLNKNKKMSKPDVPKPNTRFASPAKRTHWWDGKKNLATTFYLSLSLPKWWWILI